MDRLPNELLHIILGFLDNEIWYHFRLVSVRTYGLPTERDIMRRVNGAFNKWKVLENNLNNSKYLNIIKCYDCEGYIVYKYTDIDNRTPCCSNCYHFICDKCYGEHIRGVNCLRCINCNNFQYAYICHNCMLDCHSDYRCDSCMGEPWGEWGELPHRVPLKGAMGEGLPHSIKRDSRMY